MSPSKHPSLRRRSPWEYITSTPDSIAEDQMPLLYADGTGKAAESPRSLTPSTTLRPSIDPRQRVSPSWYLKPYSSLPDTHSRVQYCVPCQQARASRGYIERVARLFDRLYCAGCQTEHTALFFSHAARKAKPRRCIAHEGFTPSAHTLNSHCKT
jgi:hypothetical protein